jgi:hypothetical protein
VLRLLPSKKFCGRGGVWGKVRVGSLSPKAEHTGPMPLPGVVPLFVDCTNEAFKTKPQSLDNGVSVFPSLCKDV